MTLLSEPLSTEEGRTAGVFGASAKEVSALRLVAEATGKSQTRAPTLAAVRGDAVDSVLTGFSAIVETVLLLRQRVTSGVPSTLLLTASLEQGVMNEIPVVSARNARKTAMVVTPASRRAVVPVTVRAVVVTESVMSAVKTVRVNRIAQTARHVIRPLSSAAVELYL